MIAIGYIKGPHGVRGHVRVQPLTDFPDRFVAGLEVIITSAGDEGGRTCIVEDVTTSKGCPAVKLSGVETRDDAERLRGGYLKIPRAEVPPLPEGRFYVFDIVGLDVSTTDGRLLGKVSDVLHTGANDVYVVKPAGGGRDILIPAIKSVVTLIDLRSRRMVIEPLEGLV